MICSGPTATGISRGNNNKHAGMAPGTACRPGSIPKGARGTSLKTRGIYKRDRAAKGPMARENVGENKGKAGKSFRKGTEIRKESAGC